MKLLRPTSYFNSIDGIDLRSLSEAGIKNLLIDLEGTLVPRENWNKLDKKISDWLFSAKEAGFKMCILSNTLYLKASTEVSARFGIPIVIFAMKPLPFSFNKAMKVLGAKPKDTAIIGDQLFMDVLGGNILKLHTILVAPLSAEKSPARKLMRKIEDKLFKRAL